MNNKKKYLILSIFGIIFMFFGGTLSYWSWESSDNEQTKVTFTVASDFSCSVDGGGDITSSNIKLAPASCTNSKYAIKREIKVNPTITSNSTNVSMDLWLDVNNIDANLLASENFKYSLTTSSTSCIDGIIQYGTIKDNIVNNKLELLDEKIYSQTYTDTYYLYIWLDKKETNPNTMNQTFNLSLNGNCTNMDKGDPFYVVYSEPNSSLKFYKPTEGTITEGEEYNGEIVTKVYKAYENDVYTYDSTTNETTSPWNEVRDNITTISIEDEISPISTANWFTNFIKTSSIDVIKLDTSNTIDMNRMFDRTGYDESVSSFSIKGLENFNTSKVISMKAMFQAVGRYATEWDIGNLSSWDISKVTNVEYLFNIAGEHASTFNIGDLSNWNTTNILSMSYMFTLSGNNASEYKLGNLNKKTVTKTDGSTYIAWDTSNVRNMMTALGEMGENATTWNIGELSNWDVSNVVNMDWLFSNAGYSTENWNIGDISNWDISNVTSMKNMFRQSGYNTKNWYVGNLSNWDVSNVTTMLAMFENTAYNSNTFSLGNLSNWKVSNVKNINGIFNKTGRNATSFTIGDISSWDTSNVTEMVNSFSWAGEKATNWSLNLSNWNVENVDKYTNFNQGVESKVTPPTWVKADLGTT